MLQRDLAVAGMTPGRHVAGVFDRQTGEPVGVVDWLDENPSDGKPWVGLLMIRADRQGRGLASETFAGLAEQLRARGLASVRAAVSERNPAGRSLARSLGFEPVSTRRARTPSRDEVVVFERSLQ